MAKTNADNLAPDASITEIRAEILEELEEGHQYEVRAIFYYGVDEDLDDDAYWDQIDALAQYVALPDGVEPPVIEIGYEEGGETSITVVKQVSTDSQIYDLSGRIVSQQDLAPGIYLIKGQSGTHKVVR